VHLLNAFRYTTWAVVAAAAVVIGGCGQSEEDAGAAKVSGSSQAAATHAPRTNTETADRFVIRFIRDVRDGAGPAALSDYDAGVLNRVGTENALGALDTMAAITAATRPVVARHRSTRSGEVVVVSLLHGGDHSRYSFVLRRTSRDWKIVYDSLLVQGLRSYITSARSADPAKPSSRAVRATATAVSALKRAALPLRPDRRVAQSRPARRSPTETAPQARPSATTTSP
jgi:hypothetical protein